MKTEIKIILEEGSSNKAKGNCFEVLIRNLLAIHQYDIRGNINFSGMEIDLIAKHKHKDEILYVECKAKEKVSSDELSKFCFNVEFQEADYGYFFRTQELEYQAGALLSEIRKKTKYKNLTFFEPSDIIQMLSDANKIFEPISKLNSFTISKKILAVTHFGDFLIYLVDEANLFPTKFIVVNANNNSLEVKKETVEIIVKRIDELSKLEAITNFIEPIKKNELIKKEVVVETISEVQESEYWYDYLPASSTKNHFVGRDFIRTQILDFFKEVQTDKTHKRIFYLNGKSGWGKSSLLLEIKSRCENKYYKNKFFTLAIDTRSALSDNFVALSFEKLINKAIEKKFIKKTIFSKQVKFTSNLDLLSSESIEDLFQSLKAENKYLVLIFDQFEDVFRKQDLFKSFYKFLSDVTDKKPNLIVGFSWKSEFFIPNDDPAYYYWQQAKE
ncbi:MAG: AAA family ATPase, partial [Flavobacterium sp.]|uniref:AAA family ATPase n=1 Tax=Flavobacterium sp. TaxID=239 RepID=UPI0022C034D7